MGVQRKRVVPYRDGKDVARVIGGFGVESSEEVVPVPAGFPLETGPEVRTQEMGIVTSREEFATAAEQMSWQLGMDLSRVVPALVQQAQSGNTKAAEALLKVFKAMREVSDRATQAAGAGTPMPTRGIVLPGDAGVATFGKE